MSGLNPQTVDLAIIAITELFKVANTIADAAGIPVEALRMETWEETAARIRAESGKGGPT